MDWSTDFHPLADIHSFFANKNHKLHKHEGFILWNFNNTNFVHHLNWQEGTDNNADTFFFKW